MVDSIEIVIQDLNGDHRHVFDTVLAMQQNWSKESSRMDLNDVQSVSKHLRFEYFVNHSSGDLRPNLYATPFFIPSSHYTISTFLDMQEKELRMNFSIPKYLYGTNVIQFVTSPYHNKFSFPKHSSWEHQINSIYPRLMIFLENFFNDHFISRQMMNYEKIYIKRIDLSFNQIFDNKRDKDIYLSMQRFVKKKYIHEGIGKMMYDGSILFKTKGYSAKIYDKGPEFRKHDKKKIRDKFSPDKLKDLSKLAERTLRYEVTFRPIKMTALYVKHVFRKDSGIHQKRVRLFKDLRNQELRAERGTDDPIQASERNIYKVMDKVLGDTRRFYLAVSAEQQRRNDYTPEREDPGLLRDARFCRGLCEAMGRYLKQFFMDFQLSAKPKLSVYIQANDKYNQEAKAFNKTLKKQFKENLLTEDQYKKMRRPVYGSSFSMFLKLKADNELDGDILATGFFSRATFYRYKKHFQDLGFSDKGILDDDIRPSLDFGRYYTAILHEQIHAMD